MDESDLAILRTLQNAFPLAPRPYAHLGRELGVGEEELHSRVSALRHRGFIRRIAVLFDLRKLGRRACLVAARCEDGEVDRLAALLDRRSEVTHNYLRSGPLNVWFTVVLSEDGDVEDVLADVRTSPGVSAVHVFATTKLFKLDASFPLGDNTDG